MLLILLYIERMTANLLATILYIYFMDATHPYKLYYHIGHVYERNEKKRSQKHKRGGNAGKLLIASITQIFPSNLSHSVLTI